MRSFVVTAESPIDWTAFGVWLTMLLNRHGAKVLRVKGILNLAGEAAPVAIHGVRHLVHNPVHMKAWPDADRRSRIVFRQMRDTTVVSQASRLAMPSPAAGPALPLSRSHASCTASWASAT